MVKRKSVKKTGAKPRKKKEKVEQKEEEFDFNIRWEIPASFFAGVFITSLIFMYPSIVGKLFDNTTTVELTVIDDSSCPICDGSWIAQRAGLDFSKLKVRTIDASSSEAQALIKELNITSLPAAFFSDSIENAQNFTIYQQYGWINKIGDKYLLNIQGNEDLLREKSSTPTIDLFVMSKCPYGVPAQLSVLNTMDTVSGFNLSIHYIGNVVNKSDVPLQYLSSYNSNCLDTGDKFLCSLHGPSEVKADIAQLCAINLCQNWTGFIRAHIANSYNTSLAAEIAGCDVDRIVSCANSSEGYDLFENDVAIADRRGIGASPTYIYDNIYSPSYEYISSGPAYTLCTLHPTLAGCENVDNVDVPQATGSC